MIHINEMMTIATNLILLDSHLLPASFDEDEAEGRQDEHGGRGQGQSHTEQQVCVDGPDGLFKIVLKFWLENKRIKREKDKVDKSVWERDKK